MALLQRPLTLQELEAVAEAARIALVCYDTALADPKAQIPTPLHGAMHKLKQAVEVK